MLPDTITDEAHLDDLLSEPSEWLIQSFKSTITGDILVLGVAGKMGPTLARMAKRAADAAGDDRRVIGVSRFSKPEAEQQLNDWGIETIKADLLDRDTLAGLPDCPNVVFMAGMKFGASGNEPLTWAMNSYLPGMVGERFKNSRIAAFSTGNLYGLVPISGGGSVESDGLNPVGDYAMSCLGRERMFEHFAKANGTPTNIIRLNYACELRYGVLVDIATKVFNEQPIDRAMTTFNVIWQGDANAMSLHALELADSPATALNVAGPELLSIERVAEQYGELMGKNVTLTGEPSPNALLNNGQFGHEKFGYPRVPVQRLMQWITAWIQRGGASLGKPTKFEVRDGKF